MLLSHAVYLSYPVLWRNQIKGIIYYKEALKKTRCFSKEGVFAIVVRNIGSPLAFQLIFVAWRSNFVELKISCITMM